MSYIGIISKIKLDRKVKKLEQKIKQIEENNETLSIIIEKLMKDDDYIAELARKLGYARPGEKIYRFPPAEPESNKTKITNKIPAPRFKINFNIKDYLVYIITFLVVVIIYIILLTTAK